MLQDRNFSLFQDTDIENSIASLRRGFCVKFPLESVSQKLVGSHLIVVPHMHMCVLSCFSRV